MKAKNVVFFVTSLDSGGIENYLLRFLQEFHLEYGKVFVFCKSGKNGVLDGEYLNLKNVELVKRKIGYANLADINYLYKWLLKNEVKVICDFGGSFSGITMLSGYLAKIPKRLVFYRNSREKYKPSKVKDYYRKFSEEMVLRFASKILSNSKAALNYFYANNWLDDPRFQVIYNGINIEKFITDVDKDEIRNDLGIPLKSFVIGHVGRFDSQKNHVTILEVLKLLMEKYDNVYGVLCGQGVKENLSLSFIQNRDRLRVFENRKDVNKILTSFDVFFFPSTIEGQPNALIEAMVSGLPVVASNIEPIKETTPAYLHQYLKDPMDITGFVDLMEQIYNSGSISQTFQAREWAISNFNHKIKFKEFYDALD